MNKKSLNDVWVANKKIFVRVDYNVPMDKAGNITDDTRIRATIPTLEFLLAKNAAIILASHLGRPKGKVAPEFSLKPVAEKLSQLMFGREVLFATDCVGPEAKKWLPSCDPARFCCWKTCAFTPKKKRMIPNLPNNWPDWPKLWLMTLSAFPTGLMLRFMA